MAKHSLNFRNRAEKDRNSLRSDSGPSFFRPLTKIQGAIKGRNGQTNWAPAVALGACSCWKLKTASLKFGTRKSRFRNLKVAVQNFNVDVQNLKGEVQNLGVRVQNLGVDVQNLEVEVPEPRSQRSEPPGRSSEPPSRSPAPRSWALRPGQVRPNHLGAGVGDLVCCLSIASRRLVLA